MPFSPRTQRGPRGKRVLRGEAESKARILLIRARQPEAACANCVQAQPGVTKLLYKKAKIE